MPSMIQPTFFVIGAAKSGSSSLCELISQHPDICFSNPKEPKFFSHDENFSKGWQWYQKFFVGGENAIAIGDGSVHYSMRTIFPQTASRISGALDGIKIIYIVRHPLDRIVSHWMMYQRSGNPKFTTFNQDVRREYLRPTLVDASNYWFQINAYRDFLPDNQILIVFFEDFVTNPEREVRKCFEFLTLNTRVNLFNPRLVRNAANKRPEKPILKSLRSFELFEKVCAKAPVHLKYWLKSTFFLGPAPLDIEAPQWEPDTRTWIMEHLLEDTRMFLNFYGKEERYWTF